VKLSSRGNYGLRAVYEMARHYGKGPIQIRQISTHQRIPMRYLEQLLLRLKKSGIVTSVRGPMGGYVLAVDPAELSVGEVLRALEGPFQLAKCTKSNQAVHCRRMSGCISHIFWSKIEAQWQRVLDNFNLSDLVKLKDELNIADEGGMDANDF